MAYGCRTDRLLVYQSPRTSRKVISAPWPHPPSLHPSLHQSVIRLSHLRPGGPGRLGIFWTSKAVSATSLVLAQSRNVIFCCITFILWETKYKGGTWITATKMVMQWVLISSWDFDGFCYCHDKMKPTAPCSLQRCHPCLQPNAVDWFVSPAPCVLGDGENM